MDLVLALVIGSVVGGLAVWVVVAPRLTGARTQAALLRERVVDLEAALSDDAQTAAALAPLGEALRRVESHVGVLERDRAEQFGALRNLVGRVGAETAELSAQTRSLAGSLNASSVRGAWGEVQLRRVLEYAGLLPRCDFDVQVTVTGTDGRQLRPDVVVRLPGDKSLVIDAKAPMTAFLQAQDEGLPDAERATLHQEHAAALHRHVRALADKAYWSAFDITPELVVCFVPSEAMLSAALAAQPGLHEEAMRRHVALIGPAGLLALLRTVAYTWRQNTLTDNARALLTVGRELHDRLGTLGGHVGAMGRQLQRSVEAYNAMVGTLETRVLVSARRMAALGMSDEPIPPVTPVQVGPRVLTAAELIDAATASAQRDELDLDPGRWERGEDVG